MESEVQWRASKKETEKEMENKLDKNEHEGKENGIVLTGKEEMQESGGRKRESHRTVHKGKEDGGKQRESAKEETR